MFRYILFLKKIFNTKIVILVLFFEIKVENAGRYVCQAKNEVGELSVAYELEVIGLYF